MTDFLASAHPRLGEQLGKMPIAELPTPVLSVRFDNGDAVHTIDVKRDDISSSQYGGNKIRKLEYIFARARERGARRIATFGAAGSNHALATAIFAQRAGFDCTCFLSAQKPTPHVPRTLNMHRRLGTEIVRYRRGVDQLATFRRYLQGRRCWVIPLGGSSWLGAVGFVNAGLELAGQVTSGESAIPDRVYIACGTMGSSVGLALGLALAELPTELHAVRVVDEIVATRERFDRLLAKTAMMMHRLDPSIPADLASRARVCWRDEFFAGGYAVADDVTTNAVATASTDMDLALETTYTGKAMAALLHDLSSPAYDGEHMLFWNTYNSRPLPVAGARPRTPRNIPQEFMRYFD